MNIRINYHWALLILSLIGIYILAPDLDRRHGPLVSTCFAFILILNSRIVWQPKFVLRYVVFIVIDLLTYFTLFNDQPWNYLFQGGLFESSPAPLIICSLIMSFAGGLLLRNWPDRVKYFLMTSGLQVPIAIFVGADPLESFLNRIADTLGFYHSYSGAWQAWQFEWMITYYFPIYLFNKKYILNTRGDGHDY